MNMNLDIFIVDMSLAHHNCKAWTHSLDESILIDQLRLSDTCFIFFRSIRNIDQ